MPAQDLPPKRRLMRAPSPAAWQTRTAIGSQIVANAAFSTPSRSIALSSTVLSPGTPPPGLPQMSASTTGRRGQARAFAIASSGVSSGGIERPWLSNSSLASSFASAWP